MHLKRWLTSIFLLPIVIYLVFRGGTPFVLFISLVAVLSLWEYFSIVFQNKIKNNAIMIIGMIIGFVIILSLIKKTPEMILWFFSLNFLICAIISLILSKPDLPLLEAVSKQIQGIIYVPMLLSFLVMIRIGEHGTVWVFYLMCVVFAGDIGAYYVGTYFGRHKLIPRVSPGKTIEGAIGGLSANVLMGCLINYNLNGLPWGLDMPSLPWGLSILFFLMIGLMGQFGDLYESQLKRAAKIKDSGKILPGHGGILDRIDALLFAAPVAYFFKVFVF